MKTTTHTHNGKTCVGNPLYKKSVFDRARAMALLALLAAECSFAAPLRYEHDGSGISLDVPEGRMTVCAVGDEAFEVKVVPPGASDVYRSVTVVTPKKAATTVVESGGELLVSTGKATAAVDTKTGRVRFLDAKGCEVLAEAKGGRRFRRTTLVAGDESWTPEQSFESPEDESIYGLGEHQDGRLDMRGETMCLRQGNTEASVPVVWSTRGYALLWDNPSETWLNPGEEIELDGHMGTFRPEATGRYSFWLDHARAGSFMGRNAVYVDGKAVVDIRNLWVTGGSGGSVRLEGGRTCKVEAFGNDPLKVHVNYADSGRTTWRSKAGGSVDYYVFLGATPRETIASYREVCGGVPLLPKWSWGFWQCRERYSSSSELVAAVDGFRARSIPLDVIVQDWWHWGKYGWNAMIWDEGCYPDVPALTRDLHDRNARFMVSIWPKFDKKTEIYKVLKENGCIVGDTEWWDPTSQKSRDIYWDHSHRAFFDQGVDAHWQDGAEPEDPVIAGARLDIGTGDRFLNSYPLFISKAVYEGQRAMTDSRRVSILTRCAYAGQQRYGAVVWSGDVNSSWTSFRRQIAAGLGFMSSGMPFWTYDAGGFFRNDSDPSGIGKPGTQYDSDSYREKLVRWLQCATFFPVQRVHGYQSETEPWRYGKETERLMTEAIRFRYRLLPYLYSWSWRIHNGDTLMRPLAMDYPAEKALRDVADEFMCGDALLVSPVLDAMFHPEAAVPTVIPGDVFVTPDGKKGVRLAFFKGLDMKKKTGSATFANVDTRWKGEPVGGLDGWNNFSVRGETTLVAPEEGEYEIGISGDDGFRLWINGEKVVEDWQFTFTRRRAVRRAFKAGEKVKLDFEYCNEDGERDLMLDWITPAQFAKVEAERATLRNTRTTILPKGDDWYRFADNAFVKGGATVTEKCTMESIPLYVRAGSVLPVGPVLQYTSEKTDEPVEIRVYKGADGRFELYDDAGDGFAYEKGEYSIIPIVWDEQSRTLAFGALEGKGYAGMPKFRDFTVTFIGKDSVVKRSVRYEGKALVVEYYP